MEIAGGAEAIKRRERIIAEARKTAGLTQEQLAAILDTRHVYASQAENRENVTINALVDIVAAMGGSIDITINFPKDPGKEPVELPQIETLFAKS